MSNNPRIDTVEVVLIAFVLLFFVLAMAALLAPGWREVLFYGCR